jgi:hypothetical protein
MSGEGKKQIIAIVDGDVEEWRKCDGAYTNGKCPITSLVVWD